MITFKQICQYKNRWDFVWDANGGFYFPPELTGVTFVDGWARVPVSEFPSLQYEVAQIFFVTGVESSRDWVESGTATQTYDGYFEVPQTEAYRQELVRRFLTKFTSAKDTQIIRLAHGKTGDYETISGAYFQLRLGLDEYKISEFTISDTCIDHAIKISWSISAQTVYEVQVLNSAGTVLYEKREDAATTSVAIPAGRLRDGACTVQVQAGYDLAKCLHFAGAGVQTEVTKLQTTLWRIRPRIIAFEPDAVPQNRERDIAVYWTSENQQTCRLQVSQGGKEVLNLTGTKQTGFTIPANNLQRGAVQLQLTLKYTPSWGGESDAVYDTKTITFDAYGTPPQPVLTTANVMKTAFPLITWTSSDQYYFRLQILKNGGIIQDTGEVPTEQKQYQVTTPLENGQYLLRLTIRNEYSLYSPAVEKALQISADAPLQPTITYACDLARGAIVVSVENPPGQSGFQSCDLLRRKPGGEWLRIASRQPAKFTYADFAVASDVTYEYCARAMSQGAGYQDSTTVRASVTVPGTQLFAPGDPAGMLVLQLQPSRSETAKKGVYLMNYAGAAAPVVECSEERYSTVTASFFAAKEDGERLRDLYFRETVLLYRDNRGRRLFGCITGEPQIKDEAYGWCSVSFTFTETQYEEGVT